jgi:integral membrane protein
MKLPPKPAILKFFRVLALAEAISWAALLAGMFFKWVLGLTELGVQLAGPIHGMLFIAYATTALVLWKVQRWPFGVAVLAGISAVLPFATIAFERWAAARGCLTVPETETLPEAEILPEARLHANRADDDRTPDDMLV